jgi:hypothetical protein
VRPPAVGTDDACRPNMHECIMGVHDDCIPYDLPHPVLNRSALYSLSILWGPEGRCRAITCTLVSTATDVALNELSPSSVCRCNPYDQSRRRHGLTAQ